MNTNRPPTPGLVVAVAAILVGSCGPVETPPPSTTLPTTPASTVAPTATQAPTAAPTATPTPLCGTAVASGSPAPAVSGLAKFEPPDGETYFGFTYRLWGDDMPVSERESWGDTRPFAERICDSVDLELDGKTPTFIKVQNDWKSRGGALQPFYISLDNINMIHAVLGPTVVPMLEWQAGEPGLPDSAVALTSDIASGQYDNYIRQYAQDVKAYGGPLFIRLICGEFNGGWWPWCSPRANPELTAADFVGGWQRVVDIFREEDVGNVAWVWTPVASPPPPADWGRDPNWEAYYPGDEYVDWVGADLNDWGQPAWLDPLYAFGVAHSKPFFVAEFAIRHENTGLTHDQQIQWLGAMFDYFESHPKIKAVSYFNYKNNRDPDPHSPDHIFLYDGRVNYVPNVDDHDQRLIAGGDDVRALFSARIGDPRYVSVLAGAP